MDAPSGPAHGPPHLDAAALRARLPMAAAIGAMRAAFGDDTEVPPRFALGGNLLMAARVGQVTGIKVVSTVPGQAAGLVALFGADGAPLGTVDGAALTALRTGAASGLATELLAPRAASTLAVLGCGAMAADQVAAVCAVRPIGCVLLWGRSGGRAAALAERLRQQHPALEVAVAPSAAAAVAEADVVCCATPSRAPLFAAAAVRPGCHLNAVGAFRPEMAEVPAALVTAARVVVDTYEAAAREAGDLLQAGRRADAALGEVLAGRRPGRQHAAQVTLFKSVGIASQDVAAAAAALGHGAAPPAP